MAMVGDATHNSEDLAPNAGGAMRIFIFKSEASPDLGAFCGDPAGLQLPSQFKPWHVVGAVAPGPSVQTVVRANRSRDQGIPPKQEGLRCPNPPKA
jgi:hypothetical protein